MSAAKVSRIPRIASSLSKTKTSDLFIEAGSLLMAFLLWLFCFRGYFIEHITLEGTAPAYYYRIKYFLDSILSGVYPLWNPFSAWGGPDLLDMRALGEFNPFLYLIVIYKMLGASFYKAYLLYMASYYFVGCAGFYLLAKELWQDRRLAYAAFLMLLFSSLGPAAFTENILIYLTVPVIWFFYFGFKIKQEPSTVYWLGATLSLMIILTTYLPFYFLFIFVAFLAGNMLFNFNAVSTKCQEIWSSIRSHRWLVVFCALAVICSAVPGILWYKNAHNPDYLINFKHRQAVSGEFLSVNEETISAGSISGIMDWHQLFSGLNIFPGRETAVFYVSVLGYFIVLLALFNKRTEKMSVLFFMGLSVFIIGLADVSSVYRFLYEHVSVFRLVRNLFFFAYFLIPIFVLFTGEQMRGFLLNVGSRSQRIFLPIFIGLMHALILLWLLRQEEIIASTYVVWVGSLVFFLLLATHRIAWKSSLSLVLFMALLLIQPIEVFHYWTANAKKYEVPFREERQTPEFVFQRPSPEADAVIAGASGYASELKWMQDRSGIVASEYIGLKSVYELQHKVAPAILREYARNKFVFYDSVRSVPEEQFDFKEFERDLNSKRNAAIIFAEGPSLLPSQAQGQFEIITPDNSRFKLLSFGLNSIKFKTSFDSRKFLVYNDGFSKGWQAWINGIPSKVVRANYAFKGLWLEPGENMVTFRYGSPLLYGFYVFLAVLMAVLLIAVVVRSAGSLLKMK